MPKQEKDKTFVNGTITGSILIAVIVFLVIGVLKALGGPYIQLPSRVNEAENRIEQNCAEIDRMKESSERIENSIMVIQDDIKELLKRSK
jgi:hypothetical protein